MNIQTINIKSFQDLPSLKTIILKELNLFDVKKIVVDEFEQRLKIYLSRNNKTTLEFKIHRDKINSGLTFKLGTALNKVNIPDNYQIGNPLNRWLNEPIAKKAEESMRDKELLTTKLTAELSILNDFLSSLKTIGNGQITVIEIL